MELGEPTLQYLLTLPPRMAGEFERLEGRPRPEWFACSDPVNLPLGSGGGTAHLLIEAWRHTASGKPFSKWLRASRKLILHSGGQSRRLPAYAPVGKALMPIPAMRWARGHRLDQSLLDLQLPDYQRVLAHAGPDIVAMIASGDVFLRFGRHLPPFPEADVVGLGMWVAPARAKDFGVFFSPRTQPGQWAFFLQKPAPERIRELEKDYHCLVDTGLWLLSERAVNVLMSRCGWDAATGRFAGDQPERYELYAQFGLALGPRAPERDPDINALTCAVVALPEAKFDHFGTNAQMIESLSELQNIVVDETKLGGRRHADQFLQNSRFRLPLRRQENHSLWVENCIVPEGWSLASEHVLTGIPENQWCLRLDAGVCLDFVPVAETDFCIRVYGFHDTFRGRLADESTLWLGRPARDWLSLRHLKPADAGLNDEEDIQHCALFPVVPEQRLDEPFVQWLVAARPEPSPEFTRLWRELPRLSAGQIGERINLQRLYAQRARLRRECVSAMRGNFQWSVFFQLDLEHTAGMFTGGEDSLDDLEIGANAEPLHAVRDAMFRAAVLRRRGEPGWETHENSAFARLRELIVREAQLTLARPRCCVLDDQIIWARSPARLDLAGGWTDTPPYCLEYGGKVLNVAVDLNGQPPIQVFARRSNVPELVVRSIDLGVEERVRTFEELDTFARADSAFALAKAAFALAGFLPRFHADRPHASLDRQLRDFGGGIEVSLLAAVPKGSGLGTSSILATTILAALSDLCGLEWDRERLFNRTLALEQMLTTGGGWQDQAGSLFRGVKVIETEPGLAQKPLVRWLPDQLFARDYANRSVLLYYTGITRLAKNILAEIVRGIFLNSPAHIRVIDEIAAHVELTGAAVQKCDYAALAAAVRNSWRLNQKLDAETNPPQVRRILDRVQDHLAAAKLLGAGGGGYLLLLAKDEDAAARIRQTLNAEPPNPRARFVDFSLSRIGLQVTRS